MEAKMRPSAIENQILKCLHLLERGQQSMVLNYVKALTKEDKGHAKLLKFAGIFDQQDILQIEKAIQQDCENIDRNEW